MVWAEVRAKYPEQWLVVEALEAHSEKQQHRHMRVFDRNAVLETCPDGNAAFRGYRALRRKFPGREICFVYTGHEVLEIEEIGWVGPRWIDASHPPR